MSGVKGRSGGARRGTGPRRRHIQLDAEQADQLVVLTRKRRQSLNQPDLSENDVVAWLINQAATTPESLAETLLQQAQDLFQQQWEVGARQLLSGIEAHLTEAYTQAIHQLQERREREQS